MTGLAFSRRLCLALLFIIVPFVLMGGQRAGEPADPHPPAQDHTGRAVKAAFRQDPLVTLLGATFDQIGQVLGEPDEQGYDEWHGPTYYILYQHANGGAVRFSSPASIKNKTAVSIMIKPQQEFLGVRVGMHFDEIRAILGAPDFGPELGMDNLYYMDYFFGEMENGIPETLVSFSAACNECPTDLLFIKWEGFKYGHMGVSEAGGQSTAIRTTPASSKDPMPPFPHEGCAP